jgi:hypothetical protein
MTVTGNSQDGAVTGVHKDVNAEPELFLQTTFKKKYFARLPGVSQARLPVTAEIKMLTYD